MAQVWDNEVITRKLGGRDVGQELSSRHDVVQLRGIVKHDVVVYKGIVSFAILARDAAHVADRWQALLVGFPRDTSLRQLLNYVALPDDGEAGVDCHAIVA